MGLLAKGVKARQWMRGIFVEGYGSLKVWGYDIEHRRRPLLSLGCNEDRQVSGGFKWRISASIR
jgi:hypothetical protein